MDIIGVNWIVELLDDGSGQLAPPLEGTTLTFAYDGTRVSGASGCNRFFGPASLETEAHIGPLASTMMHCSSPEGVMEQERRFLDLVGAVDTITLTDTSLEMGQAGVITIVMTPSRTDLEGQWALIFYNDGSSLVSPIVGTNVTAVFEEGRLQGEGGCNRYRSAYQSDATKLRISPPVATRMSCPDPAVMEQEAVYLRLLAETRAYEIRDGRILGLTGEEGRRLLEFSRV